MHIKPSALQRKNLDILWIARSSYFTDKGLYPYLLSTYFFFIEEKVRLPLAKALLPIIKDQNNKGLLERAIKEQGEGWEPLEPFESSWTFFRKIGIGSLTRQQFEDLSQLDFSHLLDGVDIPGDAKLSLFWAGLVDFLSNSWSILEEFWLAIEIKDNMQKKTPLKTGNSGIPQFRSLIYWPDMQLEHHFMNILIRLRAGWDKLADYVLAPYYGVKPAKKWGARLNKLDQTIRPELNARQKLFWEDWLRNATYISEPYQLKDMRDLELHKIAVRAKETLGHPSATYAMNDLGNFILFEHFRLQESFLLVLAMIRTA